MAQNIWGFQGLQTPLENLTRGAYNVADYTAMRTEFNARIRALENAGGFEPTNVSILGYCHVVPGSGGYGDFSVTGSTTLGGTLSVASNATVLGNASIQQALSVGLGFTCHDAVISNSLNVQGALSTASLNVGAVTVASVHADSADVTGNVTCGGNFIGNGSLITGVISTDSTKVPLAGGTMTGNLVLTAPAAFYGDGSHLTSVNDSTKLPLTGGTLTGTLTSRNIVIGAGYNISGSGSGLTNLPSDATKLSLTGGTLTGALNTQNVTVGSGYTISGNGSGLTSVTDVTKLPLTGGLITGNLSVQSGNITVAGPGYFSGDGSHLTGVIGTDSTKLPLTGGTLTGALTTQNLIVGSGYVISGNGSGLTNLPSDASKLSLSGGTMTGQLTSQNIIISTGYKITGTGSALTTCATMIVSNDPGTDLTPGAANEKNYIMYLIYNNAAIIRLTNLYPDATNFPDHHRSITIVKRAMASGDYVVTLYLPIQAGVTWYWQTPTVNNGTGAITMPIGVFSYTFDLWWNGVGATQAFANLSSVVRV